MGREAEWIEFKVDNSNENRIAQYISALANSAALHEKTHGYLLFGIEDETLTVVGTGFRPLSTKRGNEPLEHWLNSMMKPKVVFKVFEYQFQGKDMVLFVIEAATERPVKFQGRAYIRIGSITRDMDEYPNLEKKLWLKSHSIAFEREIAKDQLTQSEVDGLLDLDTYFSLMKMPVPDTVARKVESFIKEKMVTKAGETYAITNLGAILFAKNIASFEHLERKAIRVIVYAGRDRVSTKVERAGQFGYVVKFTGLITWINDQLPMKESVDDGVRLQTQMYPEIAIRELVANAIVHQDFRETGTGVKIEIFSDRLEISNPGRPLIDVMRFLDEPPQSRNEIFAAFMRRIGICEERGSGIDKIVLSCEASHLPAPKFEIKRNHLIATLYGFKELNSMDKDDRVRSCYLHCCLRYVMNDSMTNESLRGRFAIEKHNHSIASRIIKETIEQELIRPKDPESSSRKYASYVPFWA